MATGGENRAVVSHERDPHQHTTQYRKTQSLSQPEAYLVTLGTSTLPQGPRPCDFQVKDGGLRPPQSRASIAA